MNKWIGILLLMSCFFITACDKEEEDDNGDNSLPKIEGEFNVLCYNVAGLPEILSSSSPETYTTSISPLLNDYNIVHVQEDFCYHDSLILYNTHEYVTPPMPCVPDGDGLNTFSDYPISGLDRIAWTECSGADCLTPKGFSYTQIELHDSVRIDFYNIHCNAGGGDESMEARRGNINQLMNYVNANSVGEAVILMGDFNCRYTREGDSIRTLLDQGFHDLWVDMIRDGDVPPYGDKLKDCDPLQTAFDCETVDKIFYRSNDKITITPLEYQRGDKDSFYYQGDLEQPLSDHAPLFARFRFEFE